jgi:hypothetical protein
LGHQALFKLKPGAFKLKPGAFKLKPGGFQAMGQVTECNSCAAPPWWALAEKTRTCRGRRWNPPSRGVRRGVAVQVDPFESKGLKPVFHLIGSQGLKPGAFKLRLNSIQPVSFSFDRFTG